VIANDGTLPTEPIISITGPTGKHVAYKHTVQGRPGGPVGCAPRQIRKDNYWHRRLRLRRVLRPARVSEHQVASKTGTNNAAFYNRFKGRYEDTGRTVRSGSSLTPRLVFATTMFDPAHTS
jgi:hypothetical protein